ncbi:hypothetical protein [Micromonospora sp. NPDC005707]|uniref:hypothetical protein n=1 Tax=Micromonospora sp. NPDC005707 TaxID=3157050 RepID=UPI0033DB7E8D
MKIAWERAVLHVAHSVEAPSQPGTHAERHAGADAIRGHLASEHGWDGKCREYTKLIDIHSQLHEQMDLRRRKEERRAARERAHEEEMAERQRKTVATKVVRKKRRPSKKPKRLQPLRSDGGRDAPTIYTHIQVFRGGGVESSRRRH